MGLLSLLLNGCATVIHDHTFCSPIPGDLGAVCDNFLTHNPQTLDEAHWQALQTSWLAKGYAIEVTESNAVGDLKAELEELCSKTPCDDDTSATVNALIDTLAKMEQTANRSRSLMLR